MVRRNRKTKHKGNQQQGQGKGQGNRNSTLSIGQRSRQSDEDEDSIAADFSSSSAMPSSSTFIDSTNREKNLRAGKKASSTHSQDNRRPNNSNKSSSTNDRDKIEATPSTSKGQMAQSTSNGKAKTSKDSVKSKSKSKSKARGRKDNERHDADKSTSTSSSSSSSASMVTNAVRNQVSLPSVSEDERERDEEQEQEQEEADVEQNGDFSDPEWEEVERVEQTAGQNVTARSFNKSTTSAARKKRVSKLTNKKGKKPYREMDHNEREVHFLKDVIRLQNMRQPMIPRGSFMRLVREIIMDTGGAERITAQAFDALQMASETYLTQILQDSYMLTMHRTRITLSVKDLQLLMVLRSRTQSVFY